MRLKLTGLIIAISCSLIGGNLFAQGFSFNCARDTVVPGCPPNLCITLKSLIPDPQRAATTYAVNSPTINPTCLLASNNPAIPGTNTTLSIDDKYSPILNVGFPFTFFGTPYSQLVASSNGYLSFDLSLTGLFSHWNIINGTNPQDLPSTFYDKALIMGPYHDIDVGITTSPNRLISTTTSGLSPYRTWTINYYKIPLFSGACNNLIENTHSITLYESTGIIDVNIYDMQICPTWNQGRAMVGVQNFTRDVGVMVPGRRASDPPWGAVGMNEKYRFVPVSGTPLFRRVELYDMSGNLVSTGTTVPLATGDRDVSFPNICVPAGSATQFVIKAFYDKIDDPTTEIYGLDTVTVNRTQGLAATANATAASCGISNGTINVTSTLGGVGPYQYSLDGVTWQSSPIFTGLAAGTYTVHVKDSGPTCTALVPVTVGVAGNLTTTFSQTAAACTGINNGTITINSAGGTGPYTFKLDAAAPVPGTIPYTFTGLAPGTHTVIVTDVSSGCVSTTLSFTIAVGTGVTATLTPTATACPTSANGSILVNATAGTAPFTYQLDANAPQSGSNPYTFTNVSSGTHTIIVRDAAGCTRTSSVFVSAGPSLNANFNAAATSCSGANDGTITVTPLNGSAPYSYQIDAGGFVPGTNPYTFTGLTAGTHTVDVRDASGCTRTLTLIVSAGAALTANAVPSATSCSGASNGSITVTPTSGNPPFQFQLDGGAYVAGSVPYTFTNVPAGPHTVLVQNAAGCVTNSIPVNVVAGPSMTTTVSKTDLHCFSDLSGTITVATPTVGNPPYEYSLDNVNWQPGNTFSGLAAGTYTVYYREANGCLGSQSVTITQPAALTATNATVAVVCHGENNGIITITPAGGTAPYEYSIDGGTTWGPNNVFNVAAGTYTVTIRDANGCITTQTPTVTEPATLTAFASHTNASCAGGSDGVITVTAAGGNSNYSYSIDGVNFQSNNSFNVSPGNYTVTVKDNLGCTTSFPYTVGLSNNLSLTPQTDPTICEGGSIQLNLVSNATQYAWTPKLTLNDSTIHNPVANPTVTTQYVVTATLGRCSANDTVIVHVNPAPIVDAGVPAFICYGQSYQLQASGGVQYLWSPATYLNNPNIANPIATPTKTVTYTLSIVADANGCKSLVSNNITIDVTPPFKVHTFPFDTVASANDMFQLLAVPDQPAATIFTWTPATGLSDAHISNPIVTAGAVGDVVQYQVIAETQAGCKGEAYVTVKVYKGPDIYVPTAFSPNGDGKNDKFIPFPVGIKSLNYFRVFNRWGQLVFSTTTLNQGWDGTLGGKEQGSGVYVWMAEGISNVGKVITKKGTVTLIR